MIRTAMKVGQVALREALITLTIKQIKILFKKNKHCVGMSTMLQVDNDFN